jgi:hypothetical protein
MQQNCQITTIEQAFKYLGAEHLQLNIPPLPNNQHVYLQNEYQLINVIEALNKYANDGQPWQPNWHTGDTGYELWLLPKADEQNPAGFGFSGSAYDGTRSSSVAGSRLCFKESWIKQHLMQHYVQLITEKYLITKPAAQEVAAVEVKAE